jgi:hypothetical protein
MEAAITVDDLPGHDSGDRFEIARTMLAAFRKHGLHNVYGMVNGKLVADVPESRRILDL